jgi:hypothetical protein
MSKIVSLIILLFTTGYVKLIYTTGDLKIWDKPIVWDDYKNLIK